MADTPLTRATPIWILRAVWVTLPLTAGAAAGAALGDWSDATRVTAETLLWIAWAAGLLATIAPRPETLTVLRVVAPAFFVLAVVVAFDHAPSVVEIALALACTGAAALLASSPDIGIAAANSASYGDELRVPLRTPPALFLGPLPLARIVAVLCVAGPPLLMANGEIVLGVVAVPVAIALLYVAGRALYGLSKRWAVLVPAGFVVVDAIALANPVLFLREHVTGMGPADPGPPPPEVTDLRVGAALGSMFVRFDEPAQLVLAARARRGGETIQTRELRVAVVRRDGLLRDAAARRLRVG